MWSYATNLWDTTLANGAGAGSKAVSGDGQTSNLADQFFIVAHGGLDVCDGGTYSL